MQKQETTARRRPLGDLPGNREYYAPPPGSFRRKPAAAATPSAPSAAATPSAPSAAATPSAPDAATAEPALDRLLLASSNTVGLVSQIDELLSRALHCQKISRRGEREIELFNTFLSDTNSSLKQWSSRLENLVCSSSSSSIPETDLIVSPSPLVSISAGPAESENKPSAASDDMLSDEKDLASRYPDMYGKADEGLDWFLSPLKTCVLMDPSPTDDKPIPVLQKNSKALLGTPWKGLESTNLKGRQVSETTLKEELWTEFEAASTNGLRFDKSVFQRLDGRRFIDMLGEKS